MNDSDTKQLLQNTRTIAVVGMSDKPHRASHHVAAYMKAQGYRIIPVNPTLTSVLGERCYPTLRDIPEPVDMVDVFRKSDAVPSIVDDAIAIGAKSVWMQEGVIHQDAADQASDAGLLVVMDRCILKEHERLM
ncbi:MAG: CoA-binding protein [Planctomycetia bacterium]|nr:CoA-binding protein [Planctomycetia bacterium]